MQTVAKPFWTNDEQTIYQGDCRRLLPRLAGANFAALITDPPYSSGGLFRSDRHRPTGQKYCQSGDTLGRDDFSGDSRDQRSWVAWCSLWLSEAQPALAPGAYVLMFSDWRMLPSATDAMQAAGYVWRGIVPWNKTEAARAPHKGYFRHQCEYVVWGTNGSCPAAEHDGPYPGCIEQSVLQSDKFHQTGKPTEVLHKLVRIVPEGSWILDPFAGSGTTLVAARELGRRAVGIEQEPGYCQVAAERLHAIVRESQERLF